MVPDTLKAKLRLVHLAARKLSEHLDEIEQEMREDDEGYSAVQDARNLADATEKELQQFANKE